MQQGRRPPPPWGLSRRRRLSSVLVATARGRHGGVGFRLRVPRRSRSGGFGGPRLRVPHDARGPRARRPGASRRGPSRSRLVAEAEAEWQERAPVDSELVTAWWLSSCWLSCRVDISTSSSGFGCRRSSSHTMPVQGVVLT
jgi:hypothetical protein